MFYRCRGNIVLADSFSDLIFRDFNIFNILVEPGSRLYQFRESVHFLNYHGHGIFTLCEDESADPWLWRNFDAVVCYRPLKSGIFLLQHQIHLFFYKYFISIGEIQQMKPLGSVILQIQIMNFQ